MDMAYDLALGRQIGRRYSRDDSIPLPSSPTPGRQGPRMIALLGLGVASALALSLPKKTHRALERRYYRRSFRDDPRVTRKIPIITMREMVYPPDQGG
jgi:hypothetical protein